MKKRYRKIILSAIILALLGITAQAQRFNGALVAGISASQVDGDTQAGFKKPGFYAGVSVETELDDLIGLKAELYYIGKGAKLKIDQIEEFNTTLHYVQMPFYFCFKPIENGQIDVGLAGSYLIASKLENFTETVDDGLYDMHNFDFSGVLSLIYYLGERIGVNVKFNYSIIPIKNNPNWYNNSISLGLVYKFR